MDVVTGIWRCGQCGGMWAVVRALYGGAWVWLVAGAPALAQAQAGGWTVKPQVQAGVTPLCEHALCVASDTHGELLLMHPRAALTQAGRWLVLPEPVGHWVIL